MADNFRPVDPAAPPRFLPSVKHPGAAGIVEAETPRFARIAVETEGPDGFRRLRREVVPLPDVWTAERYGAPLECLVRVWPGEEHNPIVIWPWENEGGASVMSWQPIGQHGAASLVPEGTRPATREEALEALRHWQWEHPSDRPPPDAWRILRRAPSWSRLSAYWRKVERERAKGEG
jgi:hypothetical protein